HPPHRPLQHHPRRIGPSASRAPGGFSLASARCPQDNAAAGPATARDRAPPAGRAADPGRSSAAHRANAIQVGMRFLLGVLTMTLAPCTRSPCVVPRASSRHGLRMTCAAVFVLLGSAARGPAQEPTPDKATQGYARAIAQAQADLDAGRVTEARARL